MASAVQVETTSQASKPTLNRKSPRLAYIGDERLPADVEYVMKEVQKHMMDDVTDDGRPRAIPSMPEIFICYEEVDEKEKMKRILAAGEDRKKCSHCYDVMIPFELRRLKYSQTSPARFAWTGNEISLSKVTKANEDLMVIEIKETRLQDDEVRSDGKKVQLPPKPLKKFLESPLVVNHPNGCRLISSHKMTISWLRSRLHKALNTYRERGSREEKDVEVISTIKQKDGGPLFLRLLVEKKLGSGETTEYDYLFSLCPAFRVTSCHFAIPAVRELRDFPRQVQTKFNAITKQSLWKIITKCHVGGHNHPKSQLSFIKKELFNLNKSQKTNIDKKEDEKPKGTSFGAPREMTQSQCQECEQCHNPVSRMLLEYYYQYGHIPEKEMCQADSFVTETLEFIHDSIVKDCKDNEPKVLEFEKSGSVGEKLKVVQPDEFDIMIKIDLPKSTRCYSFQSDESFPPGHVICLVKRSNTFSRNLRRCFDKSDEFGYCLAPEQLAFGWLRGKLVRAIGKYEEASPKADLKLRRRGPALLLEIAPIMADVHKLPRRIYVDLVLALKLSEDDSRYAVAKRAKEEQFYKEKVKEMKFGDGKEYQRIFDVEKPNAKEPKCPEGDEKTNFPTSEVPTLVDNGNETERSTEHARKNLQYLWRISYSAQEKVYLEHVKDMQCKNGLFGCQGVCLMILKTICAREILKHKKSVVYHKLNSYLLKTALFHVLAESDLIQDWKMHCLADRYVDLLSKLSKWEELPHFFINNKRHLESVFPEEKWCEELATKNLLDDFHATLKIQLCKRFSQIEKSFLNFKEKAKQETFEKALGDQNTEEIIHPPFKGSVGKDENDTSRLVNKQSEDNQVRHAVKTERKSGNRSDAKRILQRSGKEVRAKQKGRARKRENTKPQKTPNIQSLNYKPGPGCSKGD